MYLLTISHLTGGTLSHYRELTRRRQQQKQGSRHQQLPLALQRESSSEVLA